MSASRCWRWFRNRTVLRSDHGGTLQACACPDDGAKFLDWDSGDRSGWLSQLRDGNPEAMPPASQTHGAIHTELGALLRNHLLETGSHCRVIAEPGIVPHVRSHENVRVPDLAVTCAPPGTERLLLDPVRVV